jgi:hypothetical protein
MFSKEESIRIKKEFWKAFAEAYPKTWLLYNTKIKDVSFKFDVDNKRAEVGLYIECKDDEKRKIYFEKIQSLENILRTEYLKEVIMERKFYLENGKEISKIWVSCEQVSLFNTKTWPIIFDFFNDKMTVFEYFFYEYEDYIKNLEVNL